jgi:hypothetical protein
MDKESGDERGRPARPPDFSWHPEPELIDIRDAETSRASLERFGEAAWATGLDYV